MTDAEGLARLLPGARRVVGVGAAVAAGETVVILTDTSRQPRVAQALAAAVAEVGATPVVVTMAPIPSGVEPPAPAAAALAAAEVILTPTTGAVYHTRAVTAAAKAGARMLSLSEFTEANLIEGGAFAAFPALAPRALRLTELLSAAAEAHVTSPGGTDLRLRLDGRAAVPITGMVRAPGERSGFPDIEAFIAPLEDRSDGIVVVDASASFVGVLAEPIRIEVRGGRAVAVEGGEAAARIRGYLERAGTPNAYTLAELAFGLNPAGLIRGVIVEDEGVAGTGHVALGSNVHFGGTSDAPLHLDFVYQRPTLTLDGRVLIRDGEPGPEITG
jgi:leucyl aminopeptidase (aminopeptidase T)